MPEEDAIQLDNWFPETGYIRLRRGSTSHATGLGTGAVETLMTYAAGATAKMFGAANNRIYNVTASGAVGAADLSGLTNNRWNYTMFATSGGNFLIAVNGADLPISYDGTTWANPAITGVDESTFIHVNAHQRRLWFTPVNSLKVWYLATEAIAGAATSFDLGPLADRGGYIMAMGTWTRDGGAGMDDFAVFVTSNGQVIIYQGTDPSSSNTWAMVGVYQVGAPIGRRCLVKSGADLVVVCDSGFFSLSRVLAAQPAEQSALSISDKIIDAVADATRDYAENYGWQPIFYPKEHFLLFNIPIAENATTHQYVMNVHTGAWCRFKGMNANCWELLNNELYFGGINGTVYKADVDTSDAGAAIVGSFKTSFQYFRKRDALKRFTAIRPLIASDGALMIASGINVDFDDATPDSTETTGQPSGSEWDADDWDVAEWGGGLVQQGAWQSVTGIGYCAALRMVVETTTLRATLSAINWQYEPGAGF